MASILCRVTVLLSSCATVLLAASAGTSVVEGPRVAMRLSVVDTYREGMGRCSLDVKSKTNLHAHFLVKDSGTAMTKIPPGEWHFESIHCTSVWTTFPASRSHFEIPDSTSDLSLGSILVEFQGEDVSEQVALVRKRRRLAATTVGMSMAGVAGGVAASEFVDELPLEVKVKADAELRVRWNDRSLAAETATLLGSSDVKRIGVRIDRAP